MQRFLVTTAIPETWAKDRPLLLLGDWCLVYGKNNVSKGYNYKIAPYPWDDRKKLEDEIRRVNLLYESILTDLSSKLNSIHGVAYSLKFWRILVGPWLGVFLLLLSDRWGCIESALASNEISGSFVLDGGEELVPNDMADFSVKFSTDRWNHAIFAEMLPYLSSAPLMRSHDVFDSKWSLGNYNGDGGQTLLGMMKKMVRKMLAKLASRDDVVMCNPYLSILDELKTSIALRQLPLFYRQANRVCSSADIQSREWSIANESQSSFERCARELVVKHLPSNYLEGYEALVRAGELLRLPKTPRAIFTSNSFYSDEPFKAWAAKRVEDGVPLVIGQHGGNYGMGLWSWPEAHELQIADLYLSWGWKKPGASNVKQLCKFKSVPKRNKISSRGRILLVTVMIQRFGNTTLSMYSGPQWLRYLDDQFAFVGSLPNSIRDRVTVRLSKPDYGWNQMERWQDRFPDLDLDDGSKRLEKLVEDTSLYIGTYNATTYLDAMSANIPTVIFWNPDFMEMNPSARADFGILEDVGVFHATPKSAAQHVIRTANDSNSWWTDTKTQLAVQNFLDTYARKASSVSREVATALRDVALPRRGMG